MDCPDRPCNDRPFLITDFRSHSANSSGNCAVANNAFAIYHFISLHIEVERITTKVGRKKILEKIKQNKYRIFFLILVAVTSWTILSGADNDEPNYLDYVQLYAQVLETVKIKYLEETDPLILAEGAINGMLLKNSHYASLQPTDQESGLIKPMGSAETGLILGFKDPMIRVIDVIEESPAALSGILPGDSIIRIGKKVTPFLSIYRATRMLTGNEGETVDLVIQNAHTMMLDEFSLELKTVPGTASMQSNTVNDILTIEYRGRLDNAAIDTTAKLLNEKLPVAGIILDLRHLNQGYESIGLKLADLFVMDGEKICAVCTEDDRVIRKESSGDGYSYDGFPMVVIIDQTSAGPAETCALVLQATERATVVGDTSFGKAYKIEIVALDEEFMMHLVAGEYCHWDGHSLETGISPDFPVVFPVEKDKDAYIQTAYQVICSKLKTAGSLKG